jgi:hypothetical protein
MVSPIISDTVVDPAREIRRLYESQGASHSDFVGAVEAHFKQLLSPQDVFLQVRLIATVQL